MDPELEVDEEYRFADRYVAARSWVLAAELADRLPGMRISHTVDEAGTPMLVVHDPTGRERVQLDLLGWVLFGASSGRIRHLYWDEVFASRLGDVVDQVVAGTGPVADDGQHERRAAYRLIARLLTQGLAEEQGWLAQNVRVAGAWSAETTWLVEQFATGRQVARDVLEAALDDLVTSDPACFHEPLWVLRRELQPVALVDTGTGRVHALDGTWHRAEDLLPRAADDLSVVPPDGRDLTNALAFRHLLPEQWASLEPHPDVDPTVDLAPIRYGHVRAEAWRLVAAVVAGGADVRVVGPQTPGEICRLLDAHGRTRVCLTTAGVVVDSPGLAALDWWEVFAAPLASSVPDRLAEVLPMREHGPDAGATEAYHLVATALAGAVDDDAEWRVLHVGGGRWVVVRMLEIVLVVDEREGEVVVGRRWAHRFRAHAQGHNAA